MIVLLSPGADAELVRSELARLGQWASLERSADGASVMFVIESHSAKCDPSDIQKICGVQSVAASASPTPKLDAQGPVVDVAGVRFGGNDPVLIAGPCSVESEARIHKIAEAVAQAGARFLRGGAFKPRTSPYAFDGHGAPALSWMRHAAHATGLRVVTEVMSEMDVSLVGEHSDLLQVGSRNMQNYALLRAIGKSKRPVLLKRAMSATVEEWLSSAEHLLVHGAASVILCERGVKGFDTTTRNFIDLGAVALLSQVHRLPVVVDPSHASGRRDLILPLSRAAIGAGACGVCIEAHDDPGAALSDGPQALGLDELASVSKSIWRVWAATYGAAK